MLLAKQGIEQIFLKFSFHHIHTNGTTVLFTIFSAVNSDFIACFTHINRRPGFSAVGGKLSGYCISILSGGLIYK